MKQRLIDHIASIADPKLRTVCETLPFYTKFDTCPASLSFHHAYEGGLLAHTVEVCDTALDIHHSMVRQREQDLTAPLQWIEIPTPDILIAAALFHDLLKMEEYRFFWDWPANVVGQLLVAVPGTDESGLQKFWTHTDEYGYRIGHICGGAAQFHATAINYGVDRPIIDAVVHCILAHHGRKEWGSPVEPQTLEALILHQADMLSAKFGATKDKAP